MQPATGPWRALRALVVAAACLSVSLVGHATAGGMVPSHRLLGITLAVLSAVAYLLSGRRWTFGRLLLVLGGTQTALHPVFEYGGGHAYHSTVDSPAASIAMALAHLAAATVLAAALARCEQTLWWLCTAASALLAPLVRFLANIRTAPVPAAMPPLARPRPVMHADLPGPRNAVVEPRTTRGPPGHT